MVDSRAEYRDATKHFASWLSKAAPSIHVRLRVKKSSRCHQLSENLRGLAEVTTRYQWNASWTGRNGNVTESSNWQSSRDSLRALSQYLRQELADGTEQDFEAAANAVLEWGGGARSVGKGADAFLKALKQRGCLKSYFRTMLVHLDLETATVTEILRGPQVEKMNSMLTKVHSLLATDGLPIYDSRVALGIAALVELFRQKTGTRITEELKFPAVEREIDPVPRVVEYQIPGAPSQGSIGVRDGEASRQWAAAKVRLGWLISDVLTLNPALFGDVNAFGASLAERARAFEAALFMIGYNAGCLHPNFARGDSSVTS